MKLNKTKIKLTANSKRVLLLPFNPGNEYRIRQIIKRIMEFTQREVLVLTTDPDLRSVHLSAHRNILQNHLG